MKWVTIKGYYGVNNLGDDFILLSIINILKDKNIGINVISINDKYKDLTKDIDKNHLNIFNTKNLIINRLMSYIKIAKSDYYLIGGGGLFPSESTRVLLKTLAIIIWAKINKTKVCFFGVEITQLTKKTNKILWLRILQKIDFFVARNLYTYENLKVLTHKKNIYSASDVTFSYLNDFKRDIEKTNSKRILWVLAMPWNSNELKNKETSKRYNLFCSQIVECIKYLDRQGYKNYFQPFNYEEDLKLITCISELYGDKLGIVDTKKILLQDRRRVIGEYDFIIAMRYHAILFSLFWGKPFFAISYSPKITNFLQENGFKNNYLELGVRNQEFFGKVFDLELEELLNTLIYCLANKEELSNKSLEAGDFLRVVASKGKQILIDWIK